MCHSYSIRCICTTYENLFSRPTYYLALYIDNNDNKMTFFGNIFYLRPCSVICVPHCARAANDTTRAQMNNIPSKSHFIIIMINIQGQIICRTIFNKLYKCIVFNKNGTLSKRKLYKSSLGATKSAVLKKTFKIL